MMYFSRDRHWSATAFAFTLAALCLAFVATAQQFHTDPVGDEKVKREGLKAKRWTGDSAFYATDKANFAAFFQQYYFPAMTRNTPSDLAELGKLRVDLFKKFLWATTNTQLQNDLTAMAFKAMGPIVISKEAPPYHPSVRYNAILVIGMLDSEYANETRPPKPHPKGTAQLTYIVNASLTSNQFPPPVVLGALIGLERHAKYHQSLAPDAVKAMSTALQKFVDNEKQIQGMDPAAYAWLRLRAASALANLGSLGEQNAVHDTLIKLIATSKSLDDRCSAAALLGTFKDQTENKYDKAKVDGPATTKALFKLTSDLSAEELKRAQDFEKNPGASGVSSAPPFAQNDPVAQDDGYPRRHVLVRIKDLGTGLNAVKPALPEESQKQVDAILAAFKPVVIAASDDRTGPLGVANAVRKMSSAISATIGAPEDESEGDDVTAGSPAPAAAAAAVPAPPAAAPAAAPGIEPAAPPTADTPAAPAEAPPTAPPVATPSETAPPDGAKN